MGLAFPDAALRNHYSSLTDNIGRRVREGRHRSAGEVGLEDTAFRWLPVLAERGQR